MGKFKYHLDEHGMDLDVEMDADAQDTEIVEFDEDFPFPKNQKPDKVEAQKEWIFNLLRQIRSDPNMSFGYLNQKFPTRMYYIFNF